MSFKFCSNKPIQLIAAFIICSYWSLTALSAEYARHIYGGLEMTRWQEFGANNTRLLSEHGLRAIVKVDWENLFPRLGLINFSAQYYRGNLCYDGQTQSVSSNQIDGFFISSTSQYAGIITELEGLYPINQKGLRLLAAIGSDVWRRNITPSTDSQDNAVSGATEDYQMLFTRMGIETSHAHTYGNSKTRLGLKYPLKVNEQAAGITPQLHPGRNLSLFASHRLEINDNRHITYEIYFDSLRLSPSPAVFSHIDPSTNNPRYVHQPESHLYTIGIVVGKRF